VIVVERDCSRSARSALSASFIRSGSAPSDTVTVPPSSSKDRCARACVNPLCSAFMRVRARDSGLSTRTERRTSSAIASAVPHAGARNPAVTVEPSTPSGGASKSTFVSESPLELELFRDGAFPFGISANAVWMRRAASSGSTSPTTTNSMFSAT
jgi:hypothetical protein